ncbi:hypothetical protein J2790_002853 [Paenarthrobacter nicotinovorans]|nr:hypothetical protein [Paenarthrobacter nicotinovorans]
MLMAVPTVVRTAVLMAVPTAAPGSKAAEFERCQY